MAEKTKGNGVESVFGPVIYSYTRKQAIEDGVLVDVSEMAREAGFKFPVAMTVAAYNEYVAVTPALAAQGQSVTGRLWDVVFMAAHGIRTSKKGTGEMLFDLYVRTDPKREAPKKVTLKAHCGPGDEGEPVVTIMMPDED